MKFRLLELKIHHKMFSHQFCENNTVLSQNILKNLKPGRYVFLDGSISDNFFHPNISISAIVGMNGSGKSTLLELVYRILNNTGLCLIHALYKKSFDIDLVYIRSIYAKLIFEINDKSSYIEINDKSVYVCIGEKLFNISIEKHFYNYLFTEKDAIELAESLFYTIVTNYSLQAFISSDFNGEIVLDPNDFETIRSDIWIDKLFHKNDEYQTPVVLNPYRNKGVIDMQKEKELTEERIQALLLFFEQKKIVFLENYHLYSIDYKFSADKVIDKYIEYFSKTHNSFNENPKTNILKLFYKAAKKEGTFVYELLASLGIPRMEITQKSQYKTMSTDVLVIARMYIVFKAIAIASKKYPMFVSYYVLSTLDPLNTQLIKREIINRIHEYAELLKQKSHVTLKLHRTLALFSNHSKENLKKLVDSYLNYDNYKEIVFPEVENLTVTSILETLPPPFFEKKIILEKIGEQTQNSHLNLIPFNSLSSGEKQFVYTTSTVVYHVLNLLSIPKDGKRLVYKNICCIFDEVEICFHPEYQRLFIDKFLKLLIRTKLADFFSFNIILATHSPFILSDIPRANILYLKDGNIQDSTNFINPFAANVNDILKQSFFLNNGFIGEFAKEKILSLCKYLSRDFCDNNWNAENARDFINLIGDPMLRNLLIELYNDYSEFSNEDKIKLLESEIAKLRI